jgi:hypothetical protein
LFAHAQCFFEGDFIKGIDAHFDAFRHDPRLIGFDANAHVEVDNPLQTDHHFIHAETPGFYSESGFASQGRQGRASYWAFLYPFGKGLVAKT